jgi:hypothetical protein
MSDNSLLSSELNSDFCLTNIKSSSLSHSSVFIVNIFLHVTILFAFLNMLFNYLIAPIAINAFKNEISNNIHDMIDKSIPEVIDLNQFFNNVDDLKLSMNNILSQLSFYDSLQLSNFDKLYDILISEDLYNNLIKQYSSPNPLILAHNNYIINVGFYMSIILFVISFILILVIKLSCDDCINLSKLFIENLVTFAFVGFVEYWFFTNYAIKFIPASPSLLVNSAIQNIQLYLTPSIPL